MLRLLSSATALLFISTVAFADPPAAKTDAPAAKKVDVGTQAPVFKIKDISGKEIDLAELTAKGPVLVRLTCGCSGCDKELAYFQALHEAYKDVGLTSLAVFREPDAKVASYVKEKKLNMLYAVDTKGEAWNVFETATSRTAAGSRPARLAARSMRARTSARRPRSSAGFTTF